MFRQNMTSLRIPRMSIDSLYHNNENGIEQHENILPSKTPYLLSIFAQESRRETVRLNTRFWGLESGSTQK